MGGDLHPFFHSSIAIRSIKALANEHVLLLVGRHRVSRARFSLSLSQAFQNIYSHDLDLMLVCLQEACAYSGAFTTAPMAIW